MSRRNRDSDDDYQRESFEGQMTSLLHTFTGGFWDAVSGCAWALLIIVILFSILDGLRCNR